MSRDPGTNGEVEIVVGLPGPHQRQWSGLRCTETEGTGETEEVSTDFMCVEKDDDDDDEEGKGKCDRRGGLTEPCISTSHQRGRGEGEEGEEENYA